MRYLEMIEMVEMTKSMMELFDVDIWSRRPLFWLFREFWATPLLQMVPKYGLCPENFPLLRKGTMTAHAAFCLGRWQLVWAKTVSCSASNCRQQCGSDVGRPIKIKILLAMISIVRKISLEKFDCGIMSVSVGMFALCLLFLVLSQNNFMTWNWQQHLGLSRHGAPALAALALLLLAWWSLLLPSPQNTRPLKISASKPETVSYWHTHTHTVEKSHFGEGAQWHCCQCSQLWNHSGLKSWLCPDWDSHSCTDCCHYTRLQFIQKSFAFKVGFSDWVWNQFYSLNSVTGLNLCACHQMLVSQSAHCAGDSNLFIFLDAIASPSSYPVGQWVSGSLVVSDFEIAIASPCFASLSNWQEVTADHILQPILDQMCKILCHFLTSYKSATPSIYTSYPVQKEPAKNCCLLTIRPMVATEIQIYRPLESVFWQLLHKKRVFLAYSPYRYIFWLCSYRPENSCFQTG